MVSADRRLETTAYFTKGAHFLTATDPSSFFGALSAVTHESRIIFIGHGAPSALSLGAGNGQLVGILELDQYRIVIQSEVRPKLKDRTLDIVACSVGIGSRSPAAA